MGSDDTAEMSPYPLLRVTTFGEFALERLIQPVDTAGRLTQPVYEQLAWGELHRHGTALAMLKVLLCRAGRRATKQDLIETLWPEHEAARAAHALDVAASALRRRLLHTSTGESLLVTQRGRNETCFKLPSQQSLWVDADEFLLLSARSTQAASYGENAVPFMEEAWKLVQGEFLEDDLHHKWSYKRRQTIRGARSRILYSLVEHYLQAHCVGQAEELLFQHLEIFPTDEDALCLLISLLSQQGRRHEALTIYQYTVEAMREEMREPSPSTQTLIHEIQTRPLIREAQAAYVTRQGSCLASTIKRAQTKHLCTQFPLYIQEIQEHLRHMVYKLYKFAHINTL